MEYKLVNEVLASMLTYSDSYYRFYDEMHIEYIEDPSQHKIFSLIRKMNGDKLTVNASTVASNIETSTMIVSTEAVRNVFADIMSASKIKDLTGHLERLKEISGFKDLNELNSEISIKSLEKNSSVLDILNYVGSKIDEISKKVLSFTPRDISDMVAELREVTAIRLAKKVLYAGLQMLGIDDFDIAIDGLKKKNLVIIAARPGMGKSLVMVWAAKKIAIDNGKPVVIFSLEMSELELTTRLICATASIDFKDVENGRISLDSDIYMNAEKRVAEAPITIIEDSGVTHQQMKNICIGLKNKGGLKAAFVDHLGLMPYPNGISAGDANNGVGENSKALKRMAKSLDIGVVALSQLSRAVEKRGGEKRPILADLRDSGNIEQDADVVTFLYRPAYYGIDAEDMFMDSEEDINLLLEFIIAKNRHGPLTTIKTMVFLATNQIRKWY